MNESNSILFENYISNQLPENECVAFEKELNSNLELKTQFLSYKETNSFLEHYFSKETADFKLNLKQMAANYNAKKPVKVISIKRIVFAVAAILIVCFSIPLFNSEMPIYEDYNTFENANFDERAIENAQLKKAQDLFNESKFEQSLVYFEAEIKSNTAIELSYFYAIALIETNYFDKAEQELNLLLSKNSIFNEKSTFLLGLLYLKQKKYSDCKKVLSKISSDSEDYNKAQEILRKL